MLILFLFFCSGATALVYEVVWSKYLSLLFGSTIQAQTVVLAVFMGGLALGNKLFGARADRASKPLAIYGWIEIAIGFYALLFPVIYRLADAFFVSAGAKVLDQTGLLFLLKGGVSIALLLGPTILMGGTLPVLAAWLQKNTNDGGRNSARFYSTNSLGAVCGAGLAGFLLVQRFGLPVTLSITALVNLLIGMAAIYLGKHRATALSGKSSPVTDTSPKTEPGGGSMLLRWGCILVAITGGVSMGLEVLASRCLALIFGSSLQVFAIVLMGFILGIGLGSAVIASPKWRRWPGEITTVVLLLGTAGFIGLLVYNIENLVLVYRYAQSGLARSAIGYRYFQILIFLISICVLGLPAAALGAVLPVWIRAASVTPSLLGYRIGRLLTANTVGAVCGVLLTGFVLMPKFGLRGSFAGLGIALALAAVITAFVMRRRLAAVAGLLFSLALFVIAATGAEDWRYIFSSGLFRHQDTDESLAAKFDRRHLVDLMFYEDAADATVSVEKLRYASQELVLRINGKPDASSADDLPTQILVAQIPLLSKPGAKDVFCLGMGSGITAATALGYPIDSLTLAENCEPVLRAAKLFAPWNHVVFTDSRVRIYHEDARTVLKLTEKKYDVIIAEPSNPWTVGVGNVFSREFYQFAAQRLKPGGVMAQWFHTYEMADDVVLLVLRTFSKVFPNMEIWDVGEGDILMLGSNQPWPSDPNVYQHTFQTSGPLGDLAAVGIVSPQAVLVRQIASQRTAFAIGGPGPIQSDSHPVLEYEAPRAFYMYLGRVAKCLNRFDERTWQVDLAPQIKNEVLSELDAATLSGVFKSCLSLNQDVQDYVRMRVEGNPNSKGSPLLATPCIFRGTNDTFVFMPLNARTNLAAQQFYLAENALKSSGTREGLQNAVLTVKNVLDTLPPAEAALLSPGADYYADLAIKGCFHLGDKVMARAILLKGLQFEPDSQQLRYLARIMVREGLVQPGDLPPYEK